MYQLRLNLHLPADPLWRKEARNIKRVVDSDDPISMFEAVIVNMAETLGFGHDGNMLVGLLLDIINRFPPDIRAAIAGGIIEGYGLTLADGDTELEGRIDPKFDPLPNPDGSRRTKSGIIIP